MNIVIISQYLRNIENFEANNSRFVYIAKQLARTNNVEIITSDFNHAKKETFKKIGDLSNVKVTVFHESGYPKNVCLKRFISHRELARNIKKYLEKRERPDVVYAAVPSLAVAKICANYCKKNKVRFIIDVQDLWPEAFKMVFNIPVIKELLFLPMTINADYIYSNADEIVAVSETYMNRALKVNKKVTDGLSVFLGTDLEYFDKFRNENKIKHDNMIRLVYIGTLGHSYDLKCVIDAITILYKKGMKNICFEVLGDGPLKNDFENYAKSKEINCNFYGRLSYDIMIERLSACDIAVNPISQGAAQSIINKVGDYAAAGIPVINTQECEEYRKMVENFNIGLNVQNGNVQDLANKIEILCKDEKLRIKLGKNNRKLAEEKFDRRKTYEKIVSVIGGN